jgi:(p)ppGpp synthase/HD superfamily hydrolase
MDPIVLKMEELVLKHHKVGDVTDHLYPVFECARKYTQEVETLAAALGHDLLEDTRCTKEEIEEATNPYVAFLVDCVTDVVGPNRADRKARTYWKIRQSRRSILIKLCDRIENVRRSLNDANPRFADMYVAEDFVAA